jgi:hypothetical protein
LNKKDLLGFLETINLAKKAFETMEEKEMHLKRLVVLKLIMLDVYDGGAILENFSRLESEVLDNKLVFSLDREINKERLKMGMPPFSELFCKGSTKKTANEINS